MLLVLLATASNEVKVVGAALPRAQRACDECEPNGVVVSVLGLSSHPRVQFNFPQRSGEYMGEYSRAMVQANTQIVLIGDVLLSVEIMKTFVFWLTLCNHMSSRSRTRTPH